MTNSNTGNSNTGYFNAGNSNTGYFNAGNSNTGNSNTGDWNAGNSNTGNSNTGDWNAGDWNTGDKNVGYFNAGNSNTGDKNAGNSNTGNSNTGDWNAGDWNAGYFNTASPKTINCFNSECDVDIWNEAKKPDWIFQVYPTSWIREREMNDEEKTANPKFYICGGYLKKNNMKEEWKKAFASASKEDIELVRRLPNFDPRIFEEITGLNLGE